MAGLVKATAELLAWLVWPITVPVCPGVGVGVGGCVGFGCAVGDGCAPLPEVGWGVGDFDGAGVPVALGVEPGAGVSLLVVDVEPGAVVETG